MEEKYLTILYNLYNIVHVIKTWDLLKLPINKQKIINKIYK
jgi:hypothetical protein